MVDPFTITAGMSRRRSLASIAVLFLLTLIYLGVSSIDDSSDILNFKQPSPKLLDVSSWSTQQIPPAVPPPPKITIIAIWNPGNKPSSYLPNFFASVQANPSINLLFIVVDKHNVGRCHEPVPEGASNINQVCFTVDEYWNLHIDFLCNHWGCKGDDRAVIMAKLLERYPQDHVNSFFRPFRSAIFAKWLDSRTKLWGWCDMDVMLGNFERAFPWDVAENFDIIVPGQSGVHADDKVLLFTPGHLGFFRNSAQFTAQFLEFPNFHNISAFLHLPWIDSGAEEIDYSNYVFYHSNLTFFMFPALAYTRHYISAPGRGVFAFDSGEEHLMDFSSTANKSTNAAVRSSIDAMLDQHQNTWKQVPTISSASVEYAVQLREGLWDGFRWFPQHFAIDFVTDFSKISGHGRRYILRREPGGSVYDCEEPNIRGITFSVKPTTEDDPHDYSVLAFEFLYAHFQGEKYSPWWSLPESPVSENEVLYVSKHEGAVIWNSSGDVTFKTTPVKSEG